jgi:hypothetical protein
MTKEGAQLGYLLTTSAFTPQAYSEAAYAPKVTLLDAEKLNQITDEFGGIQREERLEVRTGHRTPVVQQVQTRQRIGCLKSFEVTFGAALGWFTALGAAGVIVVAAAMLLSVVCCVLGGIALAGAGA